MKKEFKLDIPVLIIFFNRPNMLKKVFEQVKIVKPSKLYLYQDGPRKNRLDDMDNIQRCREIVDDVDWECEVFTMYQENNVGCDPSEYIAQKWMFSSETMGIILEDDDVPSQSFFYFCKELLIRYEKDTRINMICGMNNLETYDCPYDYVFTTSETITGWASWKRVIDEWEPKVSFVNNSYYEKIYLNTFNSQFNAKEILERYKEQNEEGIAYYESILSSSAKMGSRLNIVPTKNLISNIGNEGESTHGGSSIDVLPKGIRSIFNMKTYEYDFPLIHPPYVIEDINFRNKLYRKMGVGHPWICLWRHIESIFLRIKAGEIQSIINNVKRRFK